MAPIVILLLSPIDVLTLYAVIPAIFVSAGWFGTELLKVSRLLRIVRQRYMMGKPEHALTPEQHIYVDKTIVNGAMWMKVATACIVFAVILLQFRFGYLWWGSQQYGPVRYADALTFAQFLLDDVTVLVVESVLLAAFVYGVILARSWRSELQQCYEGKFPYSAQGGNDATDV